jgi:hypothetical protein
MVIAGTRRIHAIAVDAVQDDDIAATAPGTALVPVYPAPERQRRSLPAARHDTFFVAQLIAMAQRCPQTRQLRRATPADARAAYRSTAIQNQAGQAILRMLRVA